MPATLLLITSNSKRTGNDSSVYAANGMNLGIKAYWKDNNRIVIETKKGCVAIRRRYQQLQSFEDIVKIEYIESRLQTVDCRLQTVDCRLLTVGASKKQEYEFNRANSKAVQRSLFWRKLDFGKS